MYHKEDLLCDLSQLGVSPEGVVLVHSSCKSIGPVDGRADTILDALIEYMKNGLLVLPTHTWSYINSQTDTFDVRTSPSCVGILTELFRHREGVMRSLHPTHSMAALGEGAQEFLSYCSSDENTPCHPEGPWGRLYTRNAQILMIGVDLTKCTYMHCMEEMAEVSNRISTETYNQYVIDESGNRRCIASHRHCHDSSSMFWKMEGIYLHTGAMSRGKLGDADCLLMDARRCTDLTLPLLRANEDLFTKQIEQSENEEEI